MTVKGTSFITRKKTIIDAYGKERWEAFIKKLSAKDPYFEKPIVQISRIPLEKFLFFSDKIVKEFYNGDENSYWMIGEKAAGLTLSGDGVYHSLMNNKNIKHLIEVGIQQLWFSYFDSGTIEAKLVDNVAEISIKDIPIKHVYFEYLIMGYSSKAINIYGGKAIREKVKGFSSGDDEIRYRFILTKNILNQTALELETSDDMMYGMEY